MTEQQRQKNLTVPHGHADVVLDTDAYNEIDDQFAISYLLKSTEKLNTKAIYAAPFFNERSENAKDGMHKSYHEIKRLLMLLDKQVPVFHGSEGFLQNETTPIISEAAEDLARRALDYSPQNPLYVVAIGAITNVASMLLLKPEIAENIVVVWLGGHGHHYSHTKEFNMVQDIAASRIVMGCGVPFVQLPCMGVVSGFCISKPELEYWLKSQNPLCDYLVENTVQHAESYGHGTPWTRVIWDVTAVAWLLNDDDRFMESRIEPTLLSDYNGMYDISHPTHPMRYVYHIRRDALMADLFEKLKQQ